MSFTGENEDLPRKELGIGVMVEWKEVEAIIGRRLDELRLSGDMSGANLLSSSLNEIRNVINIPPPPPMDWNSNGVNLSFTDDLPTG